MPYPPTRMRAAECNVRDSDNYADCVRSYLSFWKLVRYSWIEFSSVKRVVVAQTRVLVGENPL